MLIILPEQEPPKVRNPTVMNRIEIIPVERNPRVTKRRNERSSGVFLDEGGSEGVESCDFFKGDDFNCWKNMCALKCER